MKFIKKICLLVVTILMVFLLSSPTWAAKTTTFRGTYADSKGQIKNEHLCTVKFFSADGKKEYRQLRKNILKGKTVRVPSVSLNKNYKFAGWSRKKGGTVEIKAGSTARIKDNTRYYAVFTKIKGVRLYKNNGAYWKTIYNKSGTAVFPVVGKTTNGMYLGWSRSKGKHTMSSSDYMFGDKIPGNSGRYYMVKFLPSQDKAPSVLEKPKYDKVYFIGDSRTVGMYKALKSGCPSNVKFIAKGKQGLSWLKETAYQSLLNSVKGSGSKERKAVIFNFGVNDFDNITNYIRYMNKIAPVLKKYNCKLFYMSVNPVNSEMIKRAGCRTRTEKNVYDFNYSIRRGLCSGKNAPFKYIDACSYLQKNGWISKKLGNGIYDGLHYSANTYKRIYNYCIKSINK